MLRVLFISAGMVAQLARKINPRLPHDDCSAARYNAPPFNSRDWQIYWQEMWQEMWQEIWQEK
jgi:hypothetical protein